MMNAPEKTRLLASGLLAVTFVVGALVGAAGERVLTAREATPVQQDAKPKDDKDESAKRRGPRSIFLEPGVFDQIGATAEQRADIQKILERREQGARAIWSEFEPRMHAMMDSTRGEIRARLTEEQRQQLDALIKEKREQRSKNRNNGQPQKPSPDSAHKAPHQPRDLDLFI